MRTRGAHSCVRSTPTGLPLWTSSVSSSARRAQLADDRVERLPAARGAAGAAVHDEVVRVLGDLRVEVVHEHPQRRFLLPAASSSAPCRAARGRAAGPETMVTAASHAAGTRRFAMSCSPKRPLADRESETTMRPVGQVDVVRVHAADAARDEDLAAAERRLRVADDAAACAHAPASYVSRQSRNRLVRERGRAQPRTTPRREVAVRRRRRRTPREPTLRREVRVVPSASAAASGSCADRDGVDVGGKDREERARRGRAERRRARPRLRGGRARRRGAVRRRGRGRGRRRGGRSAWGSGARRARGRADDRDAARTSAASGDDAGARGRQRPPSASSRRTTGNRSSVTASANPQASQNAGLAALVASGRAPTLRVRLDGREARAGRSSHTASTSVAARPWCRAPRTSSRCR